MLQLDTGHHVNHSVLKVEDQAAENMQRLESLQYEVQNEEREYEQWKNKLEKELKQIEREGRNMNLSLDSCEQSIKKVSARSDFTIFV